jgi:hypothetical protein
MFATTSVNLSPHTLLALMNYLRDTGVHHWLAAMKQSADDGPPAAPRGCQWKSLFLPDGAWVRMAYQRRKELQLAAVAPAPLPSAPQSPPPTPATMPPMMQRDTPPPAGRSPSAENAATGSKTSPSTEDACATCYTGGLYPPDV